jgi:hypothetical protein
MFFHHLRFSIHLKSVNLAKSSQRTWPVCFQPKRRHFLLFPILFLHPPDPLMPRPQLLLIHLMTPPPTPLPIPLKQPGINHQQPLYPPHTSKILQRSTLAPYDGDPLNYAKLKDDQTKWLDQATTMIQDVFCNEANPISLEPWQNKTINSDTKKMTKIPDLNPAILQSICSPKISTIGSHNMFICRLRICVTKSVFSTGAWIWNPMVKQSLAYHKVEVNISNLTCDSGNMVIAGVILLKHPGFTHHLLFSLPLGANYLRTLPILTLLCTDVHKGNRKSTSGCQNAWKSPSSID